jgi:DNA-binding transcriptional regulator YdaS (Cro superfamily)
MSKKTAPQKLVETFSGMKHNVKGAKAKACRLLGISVNRLNYWTKEKMIPSCRYKMIFKAAKKHGIELNPADLVN